MKFLLILLFALPVFGQARPVYVIADDPDVRKTIERELPGVVSDPSRAQLFAEYKVIYREPAGTIFGYMEKAELRLYYYQEQKQVVVWSETAIGSPNTARRLAKKLRSELKKP